MASLPEASAHGRGRHAKNGVAVGFRGKWASRRPQRDADPAEIVPARVVLLSTCACQQGVGRTPTPSDQGRDECRLSPVRLLLYRKTKVD